MDHADHMNLLRGAVEGAGLVWADLGAGSGAFTLALADLLGPGAEIQAVDRDGSALRANALEMASRFAHARVRYMEADFAGALALPLLDGIVIANSLHFQRGQNQQGIIRRLRGYVRPGGRVVVVEYNIQRGNFAVPHPVPYPRWERLARVAGFEHTELVARRPSRFLREIYSAVSW
jgi:ubiquinone/menaquinone biosynthesis C-methylase UbiE